MVLQLNHKKGHLFTVLIKKIIHSLANEWKLKIKYIVEKHILTNFYVDFDEQPSSAYLSMVLGCYASLECSNEEKYKIEGGMGIREILY